MKAKPFFVVLLAAFVPCLAQSCASVHSTKPIAVAGTWTNSLGTVWTLKPDGTFDVDLNHDGRRDASGTYVVKDNTMTISGTGTLMPKGCRKTRGIYRVSRAEDRLHFTLVKDPCKLRIKNVTRDWRRK